MEQFIVSARKYRPQHFNEVVGQQAITNTLENAIKSNHLAQALLFTGPRGVGKTTCARILAKRINEESMENISENEDFAFNIFELDAASNNSVEDIRQLTDQVRIPPQTGKYKVYIIDEVHMLSSNAFNAFLKTLEEPPAHAIFILATTEKHKIIPTILSRCQIFDFKRITVLDIKEHLHKIAKDGNITAEDDALHLIAQKADGALRDALSIFDRVVSFCGNNLTREAVTENLNVLDYEVYFNITDLILKNDIPNILIAFNDILARGFDAHHFIIGLASHFRDLLVSKDTATIALLEVGDKTKKQYLNQSQQANLRFLIQAIDLANACDLNYRASKNQRLLIELCLMQLASLTFNSDNSEQKKKSKNFIIPAGFFKNTFVAEKLDVKIQASETKKEIKETVSKKISEITTEIKKPSLQSLGKRRASALSLKSLTEERISTKKKNVTTINIADLPRNIFTEKELLNKWQEYIAILNKKGEKLLASLLSSLKPKVEGSTLLLTLPNKRMQIELEKQQNKVIQFLRSELQNYSINFKTEVNETIEKKFAYTPQERYHFLKEKNPIIAKLKAVFDLDI